MELKPITSQVELARPAPRLWHESPALVRLVEGTRPSRWATVGSVFTLLVIAWWLSLIVLDPISTVFVILTTPIWGVAAFAAVRGLVRARGAAHDVRRLEATLVDGAWVSARVLGTDLAAGMIDLELGERTTSLAIAPERLSRIKTGDEIDVLVGAEDHVWCPLVEGFAVTLRDAADEIR